MKYRKGTFENKIDSLLPDWKSFDVIAHELWKDDGGWTVNDNFRIARGVDREDAIAALKARWEVFKINYHPRACVKDLCDANWSGDEFDSLLEVDCIAFATIRKGD